ncbi:hypothetical protein Mapa_006607 [Marchantia paleacea]|nr:hypothetical protein Mapa_006607 [Marchantia paleacea]
MVHNAGRLLCVLPHSSRFTSVSSYRAGEFVVARNGPRNRSNNFIASSLSSVPILHFVSLISPLLFMCFCVNRTSHKSRYHPLMTSDSLSWKRSKTFDPDLLTDRSMHNSAHTLRL